MASNQVKMGLKWGDSTSQTTRTVEKRTFTSAAGLRTLGISAAC
jgi:hypothetical protein